MRNHFLLIDPLDKLNPKKDSSLLLAHTLKEAGHSVHLLFEQDFYLTNEEAPYFHVYDFVSEQKPGSQYLSKFVLGGERISKLTASDMIHMRLDPPFDSRYLRICWMLKSLKSFGAQIVNDPEGIILYNEKLFAYGLPGSIPSFVGASRLDFLSFVERQKEKGVTSFILKPLDLFQGIGVEKMEANDPDLGAKFVKKCQELQGPLVVQPFIKEVAQGEVRSIYFKGQELGSILKVPVKGEFLANIAQGASYHQVELNPVQRERCEVACAELSRFGVDWVAFDILGDALSEINITCPGLLVEVSEALKTNLALKIVEQL